MMIKIAYVVGARIKVICNINASAFAELLDRYPENRYKAITMGFMPLPAG